MYIALEIIRFIINAFIITNLVDIVLMGPVFPRFEKRAKCAKFFVTPKAETVKTEKGTYFEFQGAGGCAGFSSAFILRHMGEAAKGDEIFKEVPYTYGKGIAFPKGITGFFKKRGIRMKACVGNLAALQNGETPNHADGSEDPEQVFGVICKDGLPFLCGVFKSRHYLVDGVRIITVLLGEYAPIIICCVCRLGIAFR